MIKTKESLYCPCNGINKCGLHQIQFYSKPNEEFVQPCGCGLTDDNRMIVCPMHYNELKKGESNANS